MCACVCVYVNVSVSISMYLCLLVFTFYKIYTFIHLIQIICAADICHNSQDLPPPSPLHCHLVESNTPSTENSHHIKFVPLFRLPNDSGRERQRELIICRLSFCLPACLPGLAWPGLLLLLLSLLRLLRGVFDL